jgi:hypothetical protein
MEDREVSFAAALVRLHSAVTSTREMEKVFDGNKKQSKQTRLKDKCSSHDDAHLILDPVSLVKNVIKVCGEKRKQRPQDVCDLSDEHLSNRARFTDKFNLRPYQHFMHYIPRLVNIVTVC